MARYYETHIFSRCAALQKSAHATRTCELFLLASSTSVYMDAAMADQMAGRVTPLNRNPGHDGKCIVYWMQSSIRLSDNPAFELAVHEANTHHQPLLVLFTVDTSVPKANLRNFTFMLESLAEVACGIEETGASICLRMGSATEHAISVCREGDASFLITDESHLQEGRQRRMTVARRLKIRVLQVDANVVMPVRQIPGEQYAAYTIRPKLARLMDRYLRPAASQEVKYSRTIDVTSDLDRVDVKKILEKLELSTVPPSSLYRGGEAQAQRILRAFVDRKLDGYAESRNCPERDGTSGLSPYLRFGCLSPVSMLRAAIDSAGSENGKAAFIDEAFARRELAENFTFYDPGYRSLACLPAWARRTLDDHRGDPRPVLFSLAEMEEGRTGDELWDASQHEMIATGKMSGYMRMYWGKRVIEWTRTPEEALNALLYLNDKYEIDGRSPGGYASIMWCFGKHDRAFAERPVYGKVRYMSPSAQKKKFDVRAYLKKVGFEGR